MRNTAILGASKLGKGPWRPGKKVTAIALLGGCEIDFREAELEEGVTVDFSEIRNQGGRP